MDFMNPPRPLHCSSSSGDGDTTVGQFTSPAQSSGQIPFSFSIFPQAPSPHFPLVPFPCSHFCFSISLTCPSLSKSHSSYVTQPLKRTSNAIARATKIMSKGFILFTKAIRSLQGIFPFLFQPDRTLHHRTSPALPRQRPPPLFLQCNP